MNPRIAVSVFFFILGAGFANWLARIPTVQHDLNLSEAVLGLVLLGSGIGALFGLPLTGWLLTRSPSRTVLVVSTLALGGAVVFPAFMPGPVGLFAALVVLGAAVGAVDVSVNTQAVEVEQAHGKPIMSSFHALYSLGAIVGAWTAGTAARFGIGPKAHLFAVGVAVGAIVPFVRPFLPNSEKTAERGGPTFGRPPAPLIGIGIIAFCAFLGEGAVSDWSAVYFHKILKTDESTAVAGFVAFSALMTVGRFLGDTITGRLGAVRTVLLGSLTAVAGFALVLLPNRLDAAVFGFACVGIGYACLVPTAFSAAGRVREVPSGIALAGVTTLGYLGFLLGPPVIGFVSEAFTLRGGFGVVALLTVGMAALSPAVGSSTNDGKSVLSRDSTAA